MRSSRNSFMARGVVAREEEELEIREEEARRREEEAGEPANIEDEDHANSLETDLIETADQVGEAEDEQAETEEAVDTVEALEALREVVKIAAGNGGLDRHAAALARLSLEHQYDRVGLVVHAATPSLESFGGASSRVQHTVALEADIGMKIKKIWEAIKAAFQRAIDFLVKLYDQFASTAKKNVARGEALAARAKEIKGAAKEKTFKNARLASALHIGGKVPAGDEGAKVTAEVLEGSFKNYPALLSGLEKLAEAAGKPETKPEDLASSLEALNHGLPLQPVHDAASQGIHAGEGDEVARSKELPGGQALIAVVNKTHTSAKLGIGPFKANASGPSSDEVPVLDTAAAARVAEEVVDFSKAVMSTKEVVTKATALKKKAISLIDRLAGAKEASEANKVDLAAFKTLLGMIDKPFIELNKYAAITGKNLLDQVEQSLRAHGEEAAPASAE